MCTVFLVIGLCGHYVRLRYEPEKSDDCPEARKLALAGKPVVSCTGKIKEKKEFPNVVCRREPCWLPYKQKKYGWVCCKCGTSNKSNTNKCSGDKCGKSKKPEIPGMPRKPRKPHQPCVKCTPREQKSSESPSTPTNLDVATVDDTDGDEATSAN
ncbi:hypothetical protein A9K55_007921 [Cordyceps militaris]|uniref:Uncharacterized protein n=1 Tax=Cordyceps militaris TaxID=73501 RepID=A0A2H4SFH9_CORMI|nr:hypothetical protein A9K55_007921 [Cordyceps militaris]